MNKTNDHALVLAHNHAGQLSVRGTYSHRPLFEMWCEDLNARATSGQISPRTAEGYRDRTEEWLLWLDANAGEQPPTPAHVMAWVGELRQRLAPASVNVHLASVRAFYTWTETRNAFPNIARSVRGLHVRKDEPLDCLTKEQVSQLVKLAETDAVAGLRDCAIVHLVFSTAVRSVSLCEANVGDIDLLDAVLTFRTKGATSKDSRAYLSPSALDAVRRYLSARKKHEGRELPADAPLFVAVGNRAGGKRLSYRGLLNIVHRLMELAGHITRNNEGHISMPRRFGVHSLRRSAVTAAFEHGGLEAAQALAGHADPKTTMRAYARVNKGRLLRKLSGALDLGAAA
jgi:integrase/recombinase XerD